MGEPEVLMERDGAVARIRLNRPIARNALSTAMCRTFLGVVDEVALLADRGEVNAATLEAVPPVFCAGADLKERRDMGPAEMSEHSRQIEACADRLAALPSPVIAAVGGAAKGGGFELALACDLRVVAVDARLGFPEVRFGFFPGAGGPVRLLRLVGHAVATRLLLGVRDITGAEASALHLADHVVAAEDVNATAMAEAKALAELPPNGLRALRRLLREADHDQVTWAKARARELRDALNDDPRVTRELAGFKA